MFLCKAFNLGQVGVLFETREGSRVFYIKVPATWAEVRQLLEASANVIANSDFKLRAGCLSGLLVPRFRVFDDSGGNASRQTGTRFIPFVSIRPDVSVETEGTLE